MQTNLKLRQYQTDLVKKILKTEHAKTVCQLDTAGGKSVILSEVCRLLPGVKYIVAHRIELLNQIKKHLCQWISPDQISIVRGSADIDLSAKIFLISVASLQSNADLLPEPSLIVIDEAHHCVAKTYHPLFERYPNAKILGMTATPERLDGKPLGDIFDNLICGPLTSELAEFVAEFDYYAPEWRIKDEGCLTGKEFSAKKISAANAASTVAEEVYKSYKSLLYGKSTLIFAQSIEHSQEIAAEFTKKKVRCVHLDGTTPEDIRLAAMADLAIGKIDVITSVNLFDEGLDVPSLQGVLIARRTASLTKYLQMCGRVKRQDGNTIKRIVDCTDNWIQHHLPFTDRVWSISQPVEMIGGRGMRRNLRTGQVEVEDDHSSLDQFEIVYRKVGISAKQIDWGKVKELYNQGLNDSEIAREIGCNSLRICKWRATNHLPTNIVGLDYDIISSLYEQGLNDLQIAKKLKCAKSMVGKWRKINNLPSHFTKIIDYDTVTDLYGQGLNDLQIAEQIGCRSLHISKWRKNNNLPVNIKRIDYAAVAELYRQGFSDMQIAKKLRCNAVSIGYWRKQNDLVQNRPGVNYDTLSKLYKQGLNDSQAAQALRCSPSVVSRWRILNNLPSNYSKKRE